MSKQTYVRVVDQYTGVFLVTCGKITKEINFARISQKQGDFKRNLSQSLQFITDEKKGLKSKIFLLSYSINQKPLKNGKIYKTKC
jgi:hypothetical protein